MVAGMGHALVVQGLVKNFGRVRALDGLSLTVDEGSLVGLIGPNGAGKSTLVKTICGLVTPSAGSATVCGAPAGSREARSALGYLAELFRFPQWLSADEVLEFHQQLCGSDGGTAERAEVLEFVGLTSIRTKRVGAMSKGMQQRLGIAQALLGSPRLLLLDEPTSALDPVGRRLVRDLLHEMKRRGIAVLLDSHLLGEVEQVCDRVMMIDHGRSVFEGSPHDLLNSRGVTIETGSGPRKYPEASHEDVPALVRSLVEAGEEIYRVIEDTRSLEDLYLATVEEEEEER